MTKLIRNILTTALLLLPSGAALATPSTVFWAPSTPYLQPFGVLHVTYDTYFNRKTAYPIDTGLEIGVLPWTGFQLELGFDFFYPTAALDAPILLNAKIGAPEGAYFKGSPGWSIGIFGVGFEEDVTDYNALHVMLGETFPYIGTLSAGVYYGLNPDLFRSPEGDKAQFGVMASWVSPAIDLPVLEKLYLIWDVQTGANAFGATGGGLAIYFTPAIDLITGPVFFFEKDVQPGRSAFMWSVQLDIDIDFKSKEP
jgi:hypothetical protein